ADPPPTAGPAYPSGAQEGVHGPAAMREARPVGFRARDHQGSLSDARKPALWPVQRGRDANQRSRVGRCGGWVPVLRPVPKDRREKGRGPMSGSGIMLVRTRHKQFVALDGEWARNNRFHPARSVQRAARPTAMLTDLITMPTLAAELLRTSAMRAASF